MRRLLIVSSVICFIVVVACAAVFLWGRFELRKSLPEIEGAIALQGISAAVDIYRDEYGIPHVYAENSNDLMFAVGFVCAQERLWQMDLTRRAATGRLAEIFGERLIPADLLARTIGLEHIAKQQLEKLSPEAIAGLEAFSAGVNASVERLPLLPPEFRMLKYEPDPWRPSDSLAISRLLAWQLSKNYKSELIMMKVASKVGARRAAELHPSYPKGGPFIVPIGTAAAKPIVLPYFSKAAQMLDEIVGTSGGSNSWVIGPSLTKNGAPILANDPHLSGTRMPSIWYFMHIVGGQYDVIGGVIPGLPLPLLGHNRRIGWGATNMNADVQDIFVERINADDPNQYEFDGKWLNMKVRTERINFRTKEGGQSFIDQNVRSTLHGPLINAVEPGAVEAVSLCWTGSEPTRDFEAMAGMNKAGNWRNFTHALSGFAVAPQNFIYADIDGNIGYYGAGLIPIRPSGEGTMPQRGWTSDTQWKWGVPFEEMPHTFNPKAGYIVTANNQVVPDEYKHFLSAQWAPSFRAARIAELIKSGAAHDAQTVAHMQADSKSLLAGLLLTKLLPVLEGIQDPAQAEAVAYLKRWDFDNTTDSVSATIYHEFLLRFARNTFADDMGSELTDEYLDDYYLWLERFVRLVEEGSPWFDDARTEEIETRDDIAVQSVGEAVDALRRKMGRNMQKWQWGRLHKVEFRHPLDSVFIARRLFNLGPYPFPGDGETVNRGTFGFTEPYGVTMAASVRHIMDFSRIENTFGIHTTGQSANPASRHYADYAEKWLRGEYVTMMTDPEDFIGGVEAHLRLTPAASSHD